MDGPLIKLLIDQDGVLFDYYAGFLKIWTERYPDRQVVPKESLTSFYLEDAYDPEFHKDILDITRGKGFFANLPVMPGAVEALKRIQQADNLFDAHICTSPDFDSEDQCCATEKLQAIERHFGDYWVRRTIMTKDKTIVHGDLLIDDKPEITGSMKPSWNRIVFHHDFNKDAVGPRMRGWKEWELSVLFAMNHYKDR
jgi:5'-nucleotidase